jgi:hypothetical protein
MNVAAFLREFQLTDEVARQIIVLALSSAKEEEANLLFDMFENNKNFQTYVFSLMNAFPIHIQNLLLREKLSISSQEVLQELLAVADIMHPSLKPFLDYANDVYQDLDKAKITPQTKQYIQEKLVRFAGLIFLRTSVLEEQGQEPSHTQELLKRVIDVQDPSLRFQLASHILNSLSFSHISAFQTVCKFPNYTQLAMFLLINLNPDLSEQQLDSCLRVLNQRHKGTPLLKEAAFQKIVLKGLLALFEDQTEGWPGF